MLVAFAPFLVRTRMTSLGFIIRHVQDLMMFYYTKNLFYYLIVVCQIVSSKYFSLNRVRMFPRLKSLSNLKQFSFYIIFKLLGFLSFPPLPELASLDICRDIVYHFCAKKASFSVFCNCISIICFDYQDQDSLYYKISRLSQKKFILQIYPFLSFVMASCSRISSNILWLRAEVQGVWVKCLYCAGLGDFKEAH